MCLHEKKAVPGAAKHLSANLGISPNANVMGYN